ncbi:MAG: asnB [Labilithrix sp.]|nr:asnB [Labilithrix sp.]
MCGIFGRFTWNAAPNDPTTLVPLVDLLRHRGPDGGGWWCSDGYFFGHRRLAILDLSEAGAQPMASPDGRYVVTFNGEIYNYVELEQELRAKGYVFQTRCDTEVLLHGYDAWGDGLLERLTGMFAFALADRKKGELLLARDRFGEKPLLYREGTGDVVFASELGPIAQHLAGPNGSAGDRAIDLEALAGYLCVNFVPGDRTLMSGVRRLEPGTMRKYGRKGLISTRRYYRPEPVQDARVDRGDLRGVLDELRVRLDDAVRIALRSDVPLALFLSGGIDSSLVAESAVRQGTLAAAFCVDVKAESFSEWDNAKWVADRLKLRLERVPLGPEALEDFLAIVSHADDPLADASAVAVWQLARATAKQFKVAVSGDGGDELFGGYLTYKATAVHRAVTSRIGGVARGALRAGARRIRARETKVSTSYKLLRFLRAADLPPGEAHFTWNGSWLPAEAAMLLSGDAARELARGAVRGMAARHGMSARPELGELQQVDAGEYLPNDILVKVDRMTMAHSLESRAPLLNHHLAGLALAATPRFSQSIAHPPKRLLRTLADETFGPRVSRAKKQGFSIPVHAWLRGPMRDLTMDLLSPSSIRSLGVLDETEVSRVRDRHMAAGEPLGFELWGLCVLVAWYRARVLSSARLEPERGRSALKQVHVAFDSGTVRQETP